MTAVDDLGGKLSLSAIAEARAVISALSPVESDLAAMPMSLETIPLSFFTPDRRAFAWRRLYLSLHQLPQRVILVGSIDHALELASLPEDTVGLLIVETDAHVVSTAELLPRGTQWRSLTEFGVDLGGEDRVQLVTALFNNLLPTALLVMGSQAGWEMLARYGGAIRSKAVLFATAAVSPELSAAKLADYLRSCIYALSTLYGPNELALHRLADVFGLALQERSKLRDLRGWMDADGFLSTSRAEQ